MRSFLSKFMDGYTTTGKFWLALGAFALIVDAAISYKYGVTLTWLYGVGFALVAVFFALLPDAVYSEVENRRFASGIVLAGLCIPLGLVALYSHLGYGSSIRVGDVQQASVQNAKYDDGRSTVVELKDKIKLLEANTKRLDADMDKLIGAKVGPDGWSMTVAPASPETLDGPIAAKQLEVANESKRNGCKAKCEARTNELAHLQSLRATAVKIAENQKQYNATLEALANSRNASAAVEYKSSAVVNQTNVAAQLFLAMSGATPEKSIDPDKVTFSFVNIFIAGAGSLAFMIMAPVGFFVAGRNRIKERSSAYDYTPASPSLPKLPAPQHIHTREVVKTDNGFAARAVAALDDPKLRNAIESLRGFKAA